jgi:hypothetical protein
MGVMLTEMFASPLCSQVTKEKGRGMLRIVFVAQHDPKKKQKNKKTNDWVDLCGVFLHSKVV